MPWWMKQQLLGSAVRFNTFNEGGNGGNGNPGGEGQNNGQNAGNQGENNNGNNNEDVLNTFWDQENPPKDKENNPPANPNNQNGQQGTEQERIDAFFDSMGIGFEMDDRDLAEAVQSGDFTKFKEGLNSTLKNVVMRTLAHANTIAERHSERAANGAVERANHSLNASQYQSFLMESMPELYGDKVLQPYIASTFNQALKKANGDKHKALEATKQVLSRFANKSAGAFTSMPNNSSRYRPNAAPQKEDIDFLALLNGNE